MKRRSALLILGWSAMLAAPSTAHAQGSKQRVTVTCSCDDVAGRAYLEALHHALAQSPRYREVTIKESLDNDAIRINIISLPLADTDGKPKTALSIVCLHDGVMMHQFVETCTRIPLDECAQSMVKDLHDWES